jgi:hypothetical protein
VSSDAAALEDLMHIDRSAAVVQGTSFPLGQRAVCIDALFEWVVPFEEGVEGEQGIDDRLRARPVEKRAEPVGGSA